MGQPKRAAELTEKALTNVLRGSVGSVSRRACVTPPVKWGATGSAFLSKFNPDLQSACARYPERSICGGAPTLGQVRGCYGDAVLMSWLDIQLSDLAMFAGVRKDEAGTMTERLAQVIADNYGHMKVSELMLFLQHFKSGRYGRFYGQFDPMVVTDALYGFQTYRSEVLSAVERRAERDQRDRAREERRRMETAGELMSREEWEELRWLFNMGYERSGD